MAKLNSQEIAAKWQRNTGAAQTAMKEGVMRVTESPMERAAQAKDRYVAGVQAAADSGKWEEGLRSVSLDDWKRLMIDKGVARVAGGVKEAMPKMVQFMDQLLPYTDAVSREIQAMPKGTLSDSAARMVKNMEKMSEFRFRKRK